jgi:hypothetical protein
MAVFKSLRVKSKAYVFKYEGNEKLKEPALAVFVRFPLPDEYFLLNGKDTLYRDVDFKKVGKKDSKEIEKLFAAFLNSYFTDTVSNVP